MIGSDGFGVMDVLGDVCSVVGIEVDVLANMDGVFVRFRGMVAGVDFIIREEVYGFIRIYTGNDLDIETLVWLRYYSSNLICPNKETGERTEYLALAFSGSIDHMYILHVLRGEWCILENIKYGCNGPKSEDVVPGRRTILRHLSMCRRLRSSELYLGFR